MSDTEKTFVTKSKLISEIRDLGVSEGQAVMLHASVKNIGWIVGGPQIILEALLNILTPTGTLMMLVSWEDNPYDLDRWTEERRQAYLKECPAFDPMSSRADTREMGILTECLRSWPNSIRSCHPFGYSAVGELASYLIKHQQFQYREGAGSPLEKLCEVDGKVLLLGSPTAKVTLLHYAESIAQVPNKKIDRYKMPILQNGKRTWVEFEEYDTTHGIVPWSGDYFQTIVDEYIDKGHGVHGSVGMAQCYLFDAKELNNYSVDWMERNFNETK